MIRLQDLLQATGGRLHGQAGADQFAELAFDSRRIIQGDSPGRGPLFVAVKSSTGDGHDYIIEAVLRGATGVLCQHVPPELPRHVTCLVVKDTRQALLDWAGYVLRQANIPLIAVTGSSGKTVTKEAIAAVLSTRFSVFRNQGSYSGRYGLPIALGRLEPCHSIAVLELAADAVNEVHDLAQLTRPSVGVVTAVNWAHAEILGSIAGIEREKGRLIESLPADGFAVLNRDDARVWSMRSRTTARIVSYGLGEPPRSDTDYLASDVRCTSGGTRFVLSSRSTASSPSVSLRLLGRHHVYAALAAIAVGRLYDVPMPDILAALAEFAPLPGRLNPIPGRNSTTVLDDSYDAELACTLAALDTLADCFPHRRKIAVLGGIDQSGWQERAAAQIGARAAAVVDHLVLKGESAQEIRGAAALAGLDPARAFATYTNEEAAQYVLKLLEPGDIVLIKGPREERMEAITRELMQEPERAVGSLVRQEAAFHHVQLSLPERPTCLRVDLGAIAGNLRLVRQEVGQGVDIMIVLKADAYGHGAVRVARTALNSGAKMLGVACLSEAVMLRRAEIQEPILVLGYTPAWQARESVLHDVATTVFDLDTAHALNQAAHDLGRTARVHVKVDTGMGRLGLLPEQVLPFLHQARTLPNLLIEGLFTHFSVADEADKSYTRQQMGHFRAILDLLHESGIHIPIVHAANSAALLTVPDSRFNMVRLGIALYGLAPSVDTPLPAGFRPALTFETRVAQVKTLPSGSFVSYGNTYQTQGEEKIAVIPVGYADGFRRGPAHWQYVLVRGERAPIVGRVCMDQTMINVTNIPGVRQGDPVVLIGQQGDQTITVQQVAEWLGTIGYEVVSEILARVPRVS
jgi:alanine racemase